MCLSDDRCAASSRGPFSCEALASWRHICHQEVLCALRRPDSWYYAFEQSAAGRAPDGLSYELTVQHQSPPLQAFATKAQPTHTLARASLPTPLHAVGNALVGIESTRQLREAGAHLYGDAFVDARVLQVGERATPEDPFHFVGVKYLCVKTPMSKPRDYVFFEYSGSAVDANGELVVFHVSRSMPEDAIDLSRYNWLLPQAVRGEISMTYLLRGTHAGARTEVTAQGMHCVSGKVRAWAVSKLVQPLADSLINMATLGAAQALQQKMRDASRMSPLLLTKKSGGSPRSATHPRAPACRVCMRGKRLLPSTRVCVGCDREVCKACTLKLHFLSGDDGDKVLLRFCLNCVADARSAAGRYSHSDAAVSGSSARSTSGLYGRGLRHTSSAASLSPVMSM